MPVDTSRPCRGPVTLVVSRVEPHGAAVFTWTFVNEAAAMCVTRAFRHDERWLLVRGAFHSAPDALAAASLPDSVLTEAGGVRKCDKLPTPPLRRSA